MSGWQKTKIGEFLFERKGKYKPDDPVIAGLSRIQKIDFSGNFHVSEKKSRTNMILIYPGDLVISGINVAKGAMGIYNGDEKVKATIHYSSYTFDTEKINVEYFKRFLRSAEFIRLLKEQVRGGIKTEIKPKHLLPLEINLPDLPEQEKILAHFQSVETGHAELKAEISSQANLLKKLRQRILQEAIEGKLTADWRTENPDVEPASALLERIQAKKAQLIAEKKIRKQKELPPIGEDEIPFELPQGWEWVRLGNMSSILGDGLHGTPTFSEDGEYFFVNGNNLSDGVIEIKQDTKRTTHEEFVKYKKDLTLRTVLVSINGTLGNVAFYNNEQIVLGKSACYFNLLSGIDKKYIKHFIKSSFFLDYAVFVASETTIKNVSLKAMRLMVIPLPPLAEQKVIVAKVETLLALCDQLESEITQNQDNAEKLMQAVLREAFSQNTN